MARYNLIKNFISEDERQEFLKWYDEHLFANDGTFHQAVHGSYVGMNETLLSTRYTKIEEYPAIFYKIQKRITDMFSFLVVPNKENDKGAFTGNARGIISHVHLHKGYTGPHIDGVPSGFENQIGCNLLLSKPTKGSRLFVDGIERVLNERDLCMYSPGKFEHYVTQNADPNKNRIIALYRFINDTDWERGESIVRDYGL